MKGIKIGFIVVISAVLGGCLVPEAIKRSEITSQQLYADGVIRSKTLDFNDSTLHYVFGGNPSKPAIVFIHGTPGSWRVFGPQLEDPELRQAAYLIAIDRPWLGRLYNQHTEHKNILSNTGEIARTAPTRIEKPT